MSDKAMMFEYSCDECSAEFEELARREDQVPCPECESLNTRRLVSAPRLDPKMGVDLSMPTMADKWARTRRQKARLEERRKRDHGL